MVELVESMVKEFHAAMRLGDKDRPGHPGLQVESLRRKLLMEETVEAIEAMCMGDITDIALELADVVYVCYGAALEYGIPLDEVIVEKHRSNMSKLDDDGRPIIRGDGKILKGPNFSAPDISDLI
jgi:predicted HAD superfamily Cof-like phosphohydrolase